VDQLASKYADFFRTSSRCKPPHLNSDNFRDDIFQADIISRNDIKSAKALFKYLEGINDKLNKRTDQQWEAILSRDGVLGKAAAAALAKSRKGGFYLGLAPMSTWSL